MKIDNLKSKIENLNVDQKKELINFIKSTYSVFDEYSNITKCPYCNSIHIIKNGTRNNINRYLCKNCHKSFTYKSNTVLSGIHKLNKWNGFIEDFMGLNITSLKLISKKLNISEQTAFNWRHKLISAMDVKSKSFNNENIEFDEAFFLISRKGRKLNLLGNKKAYKYWRRNQIGDSDYNVKLFFAYGRKNNKLELYKSHMGRTSREDLKLYFDDRFSNSMIYTDKHPTYKSFFNEIDTLTHESFLAKKHIDIQRPEIHNQTVNAYTKSFKDFVNHHLKGVSTKYIGFYAKWYEYIIQVKGYIKQIDNKLKFDVSNLICNDILNDKEGLMSYRESELLFIKFLRENNRTNYGECRNHYYRKYLEVIRDFEEINSILKVA